MRVLVMMISTVLVFAACGGGDTAEVTDPTVPTGTVGDVVLEVSEAGGFMPIEFSLQRVPRFTVFADGRVVSPTSEQFAFPAPAVVPLVERQLDAETLADLLAFVSDMGLTDEESIELNNAPNVADATSTVVRYFDGNGEHRISIYALGFGGATSDARIAIVQSIVSTLEGATTVTGDAYRPDRLMVFVQEAAFLGLEQTRSGGSWPLSTTPDDLPIGDDVDFVACVTLVGEDAQEALSALGEADSITTWDFGGTAYRLLARPLLPHQDGC